MPFERCWGATGSSACRTTTLKALLEQRQRPAGSYRSPQTSGERAYKQQRNRSLPDRKDLNSSPDHSSSRWVINFSTIDEDEAKRFPVCYQLALDRVFQYRQSLASRNQSGADRAKRWWQFDRPTPALYAALSGSMRVVVFVQTSKTKYPAFVRPGIVFDQKTVVIASEKASVFGLLCSHVHQVWVLAYGSSLRTDAVYAPSDCFETFAFPAYFNGLESIGECYHDHRSQIMLARQEGLTKTYNRFHNPTKSAPTSRNSANSMSRWTTP